MYGHANKVCCCCYTWVQMLLQIGPLLRLGSNCYYRWDFYYPWVQCYYGWDPYYTWVQLLHLCLQQCAFDTERGDEWSLPAFASTSRDKKLALRAVKKIII